MKRLSQHIPSALKSQSNVERSNGKRETLYISYVHNEMTFSLLIQRKSCRLPMSEIQRNELKCLGHVPTELLILDQDSVAPILVSPTEDQSERIAATDVQIVPL